MHPVNRADHGLPDNKPPRASFFDLKFTPQTNSSPLLRYHLCWAPPLHASCARCCCPAHDATVATSCALATMVHRPTARTSQMPTPQRSSRGQPWIMVAACTTSPPPQTYITPRAAPTNRPSHVYMPRRSTTCCPVWQISRSSKQPPRRLRLTAAVSPGGQERTRCCRPCSSCMKSCCRCPWSSAQPST
jgi:hypothetical protein